jgi:hypothetical protein
MTTLIMNVAGWTGVVLLLLAYILVSTRRVDGDTFTYQILNITGALLLIINSYYFGAYPSVGVNIAWIGIALFTLIKIIRKQKISAQP